MQVWSLFHSDQVLDSSVTRGGGKVEFLGMLGGGGGGWAAHLTWSKVKRGHEGFGGHMLP